MRSLRWLVLSVSSISVVSLAALVGCGDSGSGGSGGSGGTSTSNTTSSTTASVGSTTSTTTAGSTTSTSASTGTGGGGNFACLGVPLPTTAPAMVTVSGQSQSIGINGATPEPMVAIEFFKNGASNPIANTTSDAQGTYSVMLATGGTPIDGYIHGQKMGFLDTYLYPPVPVAADQDQGTVLMITSGTFGLLSQFSGATQDPGKGFIAVIVADCDNKPIAGATVTTNPPGSSVHYNSGGFPSQSAASTDTDGIAYVFGLPAGDVVVDAMAGGNDLREHTVNARADVVTTTAVQP